MDEISIRYLILFYGSTLFLGDLIKTINDKNMVPGRLLPF